MKNTNKPTSEHIQKAIDNGHLMDYITNTHTHVCNHKHRSDVESLERTLNQVPVNSVFNENIDVDYLIEEVLYAQAHLVEQWLEEAKQGTRQGFYARMENYDYDTLGTGLIYDRKTNLIKEYQSDNITIVLKKDDSSELGFHLVTAYPDMNVPDIKPTKRNLKDITLQTETFRQASPVEKAYLLYRTSYQSNSSISFSKGDDKHPDAIFLYADTNNPNTKHKIRIREDSCELTTVYKDPYTQTQTPVKTDYVTIRDQYVGQYNNYKVSLAQPQIRGRFALDEPEISRDIEYLQKNIKEFAQMQTPCNHRSHQQNVHDKRVAQLNNLVKTSTPTNHEERNITD